MTANDVQMRWVNQERAQRSSNPEWCYVGYMEAGALSHFHMICLELKFVTCLVGYCDVRLVWECL